MKHKNRRGRPEPTEPLSAGRVEYLEQARQRVRSRHLRRTVLAVAVLTAVIAFATGLVGASVSRAKDLLDTVNIALRREVSWPQNTGIAEIDQLEPLSGGFVELGGDSCVVYSESGSRLNAIQSGYARPALAAGKTRFVLYNRSGNEFRVESRTQNLYTKTTENNIYLCAVADDGKVAVVTGDVRNIAQLLVYSAAMEQQLSWALTSAEGTPLRMAFSPDSRRLAAAAVTASAGQMVTNLYVLPLNQGDPVAVGSQNGLPQWLGWVSDDAILAVYDSRAVLYGAAGGERASYDFGGQELAAVSQDASGVALLLSSGQTMQAVLLDRSLNVQFSGGVPSAHRILRAGERFYLLTDSSVECYDLAGVRQWGQELSARPQALLAGKKHLLLFSGNTVQPLSAPEPQAEAAQ